VLISVGGERGRWTPIFANAHNFIDSIAGIIEKYNLDGVDLDIEGYSTPPAIVVQTIRMLRERLGRTRLIVVSPENVTVFPAPQIAVPDAHTGSGAWNYFVPILRACIDDIDLVQPQFYNNYYINYGHAGDAQWIVDNYLGWTNQLPYQIANFDGVPKHKLVIGIPVARSCGQKMCSDSHMFISL
jgi:chitinase